MRILAGIGGSITDGDWRPSRSDSSSNWIVFGHAVSSPPRVFQS